MPLVFNANIKGIYKATENISSHPTAPLTTHRSLNAISRKDAKTQRFDQALSRLTSHISRLTPHVSRLTMKIFRTESTEYTEPHSLF